jgi:hypothetical protein
MDEWMDGWMDDTNGPMQNPSINRSTWRSPRRRVPKDRTGLCSQSRSTKSSSFVRVLDRLLTFPLHLSPSGQLAPNATCMICVCACACEQVSVVSSSIAPSVRPPQVSHSNTPAAAAQQEASKGRSGNRQTAGLSHTHHNHTHPSVPGRRWRRGGRGGRSTSWLVSVLSVHIRVWECVGVWAWVWIVVCVEQPSEERQDDG